MERCEFSSDGIWCVGYWHWPEVRKPLPPLVVMGHGYGTEWQFGSQSYIDAFTSAGFAVFTFDYRHFGESKGEPRQLIDIDKQLDDWRAALNYIRHHSLVDISRISLWGSSLGGGHAMTIAAEDSAIKALVVQIPHCDATEASKDYSFSYQVTAFLHIVFDGMLRLVGRTHKIPIVAEPNSFGVMTHPGWKQAYLDLVPVKSQWQNATPARSLLSGRDYSPGKNAGAIKCPSLVIYAGQDAGVPVHTVESTVLKLKDREFKRFEGDHFAVYSGNLNKQAVAWQVEFLKRKILG